MLIKQAAFPCDTVKLFAEIISEDSNLSKTNLKLQDIPITPKNIS